jgi:hypothetical protein
MGKEIDLLRQAEQEARTVETWADLSNFLFDPDFGLLIKAYPTKAERTAFMKTPEYKRIRQLVAEVRQRTGLVEGATPKKKSGRFLVRLPQSLHAALEIEAQREGVSLNQLVVAKLAFQLSSLVEKKEAGPTRTAAPA